MDKQEKISEVSKSTDQRSDTPRERLENGETMQEDWRDLARQIQEETDTHKLVSLVQELIGKFDEEKLRKSPPRAGSTT